jgi:predicted O-linked N-acetylglucosamine transferase (SPINDLY family)
MTPQETIAHLQSQLDECRKELSASRIENEKLNDFANAKEALAWSNQVDGARLHAKLTAAETALAASQAELADMTHRFKHYSATMEAERAARNPRNTMSYIHEIQGEADIEGKACAEVDRLRVELADAKRLTKAQDDYIAFLYEVEKGRAGMIVSHPHFAYPQSQIDEGIRLRAAIDKAEGRT